MKIEVTSFEMVPKDYHYDPREIVERKPMGHITKVVFANGSIKYFIFDSQIGASEISAKEGIEAERVFDQMKRLLAQSALDNI